MLEISQEVKTDDFICDMNGLFRNRYRIVNHMTGEIIKDLKNIPEYIIITQVEFTDDFEPIFYINI